MSSAENRPSVLWCLYFNITDGSGLEPQGHDLPSNVYLCSGPDGALSHENAIKQVNRPDAPLSRERPSVGQTKPSPSGPPLMAPTVFQAQSIFSKILPGEDFCPPAPNPEDIIYNGDAPTEGEDTEGEKDHQENLEEVETQEHPQTEE